MKVVRNVRLFECIGILERYKRPTDIRRLFALGESMSKGEKLEERLRPVFDRWTAERDLKARSEIIEAYLWLPAYIAGRYTGKGHEFDDLYQTGCVGLIEAVDGFEPSAGSFFAYAYAMILGEIRHLFRDDRIIRTRTKEAPEVFRGQIESGTYEDEGIETIGTAEALDAVLNDLADRERRIILMILNGASQRDVADTVGTYQVEISRIYKKFRAAVRRELYES